jgi:hypothetical protein
MKNRGILYDCEYSGKFFLQPLHHDKNDRTNLTIPECQVKQLTKSPAIGVGIFAACLWPVFINGTIVVGHQKRAGGMIENVIVIFIEMHILFDYLRWFQLERFCQTFYIFIGDHRTDAAATVGTGEAVERAKCLIV